MTTDNKPSGPFSRFIIWLLRKFTGADAPWPLGKWFAWFFGPDEEKLQTHEKQFPGYDLASLHRALTSFFAECCERHHEVGSTQWWTTRLLLDSFKGPGG